MFGFLDFVVFLDSLFYTINELIRTNDVLQILQKSRFVSVSRLLFHLGDLLDLALEN